MRKPDGTWEKFEDYVIDFSLEKMREGERISLVTLIHIEGSSPRPLGAQMSVSESGDWVGYLSGGCLERAVVEQAMATIHQGGGQRVRYGRGSHYIDIQLPCGSAIELAFDVTMSQQDLERVDMSIARRLPASLRIPTFLDRPSPKSIIRLTHPRRKLIVAGVGPAAIQLVKAGQLSGFATTLHSPDTSTRAAASAEGIETIAIIGANAAPDYGADQRSAIVLMFHDHEWERTLIPAALKTPAFYIGVMGSRRTHAERLKSLINLGIDSHALGRVRGPAGLFSGAKSAPDVAVSVLAEIMQIERAANRADMSFLEEVAAESQAISA
jgi:xanthine dehydrogenase accessory factor